MIVYILIHVDHLIQNKSINVVFYSSNAENKNSKQKSALFYNNICFTKNVSTPFFIQIGSNFQKSIIGILLAKLRSE